MNWMVQDFVNRATRSPAATGCFGGGIHDPLTAFYLLDYCPYKRGKALNVLLAGGSNLQHTVFPGKYFPGDNQADL